MGTLTTLQYQYRFLGVPFFLSSFALLPFFGARHLETTRRHSNTELRSVEKGTRTVTVNTQYYRASTARLSPLPFAATVANARTPQLLSGPHIPLFSPTRDTTHSPPPPPMSASSSNTFDFFDAAATEWQYVPRGSALFNPHTSAHPSPHASINPSPSPHLDASGGMNANTNPHLTVQPTVAFRAASPQSTVSSGSPVGPADVGRPGKKRSIDRNRKPCGRCSGSKRKCEPIEGSPNLCERCRRAGHSECDPYKSWTERKANLRGDGSLSPLDKENLSSRSTSPSYIGAGSPPVGYPSPQQTDHEVHAGSATTQEWVLNQSAASGVDIALCENFYPNQNQNVVVPPFPQQDIHQNASGYVQSIKPCCHVCNTPYNEYHAHLINYALTLLARSSQYEPDLSLLGAYGHVQTSNSDPSFQNSFN